MTYYFIVYQVSDKCGERTENAVTATHPLEWLEYITCHPIPHRDRFYRMLWWKKFDANSINSKTLDNLIEKFPE